MTGGWLALKLLGKQASAVQTPSLEYSLTAIPKTNLALRTALSRWRAREFHRLVACAILTVGCPRNPRAPDLAKLWQQSLDAGSNHDLDALMSFFAPDAVWDTDDTGFGRFEGAAAIRSFIEDFWGTFEDHAVEPEEIVDCGHGVVFEGIREEGRLVGSATRVKQQRVWVALRVQRKIAWGAVYLDPDEARGAAERLAQERR